MNAPYERRENGEGQSADPTSRIQPPYEKEKTSRHYAKPKGIGPGIGGFRIEALQRKAREHGKPSGLWMNQTRSQPGDKHKRDRRERHRRKTIAYLGNAKNRVRRVCERIINRFRHLRGVRERRIVRSLVD